MLQPTVRFQSMRHARLVFVASVLAVSSASAGVLNSPNEFTGATVLIDFEKFPDGTTVPYVSKSLKDQWASLGVVISDGSPPTGASAYAGVLNLNPHSGTRAITDSDLPGGFLRFTFAKPVFEAGLWVQKPVGAVRVDFFDESGALIAMLSPPQGDKFAGYSSLSGIKSLVVSDSTYFTVDDLEFSDTCIQKVGTGCPGTGGLIPGLGITPCAVAGAPISVIADHALGGASAFLAIGAGTGSVPVGGTCTLNVSPVFFVIGPLPMGGSGPGAGVLTLTGVIPSNASIGTTFSLQAFVIDPFSSTGFSSSNAVVATIG